MSSALTIVAIERDLCQTNRTSADHISFYLMSLCSHESMSPYWMCWCFLDVQQDEADVVLDQLCLMHIFHSITVSTGMIIIHVFICVDGAFFTHLPS